MQMIVSKNYSGARLDRFTSNELNIPHALTSKLLRKGKIKVNGKKAEISTRLNEGDEITLPPSLQITPKQAKKGENFVSEQMLVDFKSNIIYETEDFFAINKPSGLATQGGSKVKLCVDDFLMNLNPEYRLVHRLDKETSGVLIIAKNRLSATNITKDFAQKDIKKTYIAITNGVPNPSNGTIESSLLKVNGLVEASSEGKHSITHYKTLDTSEGFALLEIVIETGRMHQIRSHLNSINCFIVGDLKYGDTTSSLALKVLPKMLLHSYKLKYGEIEIKADIPNYFKDIFIKYLDK